ncbi:MULTISPECIES: hypothetical protein [Bradyrhizobium]|uniref:hypothetical protein n=1 Tax=Bradyrhizobium centrosematis TaxID=1300039 RepID=UPI00216992D8|nr:hypothetical protein [Bradyrhizobium centrosematis]MCS3765579.1 hypothetical protein [Bradyrhizobium centrosematis]MCS3778113.1 hypothetical protein [Bradyrhizobium centrosematis]
MTVSKYQFRHELRQLIEKHMSSSSTFEDYVLITGELEEAKNRLELDAEKFPDEEVDACEL